MIDTNQINNWLIQAGEIGLKLQQNIKAAEKADKTLVTQADRDIEQFLTQQIKSHYPDHAIIAEEGTKSLGQEYSWIIDPLDGTGAYATGLPIWSISVGILKGLKPYLGFIYVPSTQETYYTASPDKVFYKASLLSSLPVPTINQKSSIFISPRTFQYYQLDFPGNIYSLGSGIMHHCLVTRGIATCSLSLEPSIWDLAGVYPLLQATGATIKYLSGKSLILADLIKGNKTTEPILCGHPDAINQIAAMILPK